MPWRPPPTRNALWQAARCGCGWGCTPASRFGADEGYVGFDVHRAARIAAAGHGGQVLAVAGDAPISPVADVRDLGLHRLKDLSAPERLFQLGTEDFPPLKTLHETNLPVPATPFLGREREIDRSRSLLRRSDVRLVTLTGPGGSGKTRLALQAAAAAADDYDRGSGGCRSPRSPIPRSSRRPPLRRSVRRTRSPRRWATSGCCSCSTTSSICSTQPPARRDDRSCPQPDVLVTSREPLHVDGEWEVAVDPLREREAVELFCSGPRRPLRLRRQRRGGRDLPAPRLPAARDRAGGRPRQGALAAVLLERLEQRLPLLAGGSRSAPERQRTLRATIAWSHDLLTPAEQDLFARLAVFAGGCTLEAAEEICGADLDAIASLVDKSLLRRTGDRYWMLETIREFAAERLARARRRTKTSAAATPTTSSPARRRTSAGSSRA